MRMRRGTMGLCIAVLATVGVAHAQPTDQEYREYSEEA
jgi:hypothetical protein